MSQELVWMSNATKAIAKVATIGDAKTIADKAAAIRVFATQQGWSVEQRAVISEIEIRATAKMGELLKAMPKQSGARGVGKKVESPTGTPLSDAGVTKKQSSRAQQVASVPAKEREKYIAENKANDKLSVTGLVRLARKRKRKVIEQQAAEDSQGVPATWNLTEKQDAVECAAVITDPPYGILNEPWEPKDLKAFTKEWCHRWCECGADTMFIFWSQRYLFDGRQWFDECLKGYQFQQLLVWHYRNNKSPQSRQGFKQTWEPIFFYRRIGATRQITVSGSEWGEDLHDFDCHVAAVPQSNFNGDNAKQHPAQKPVSVMRWLVNASTNHGELVVDPFAGSGTTGIAAAQLGRRFHGIETNAEYLKLATERIAAYGTASL